MFHRSFLQAIVFIATPSRLLRRVMQTVKIVLTVHFDQAPSGIVAALTILALQQVEVGVVNGRSSESGSALRLPVRECGLLGRPHQLVSQHLQFYPSDPLRLGRLCMRIKW